MRISDWSSDGCSSDLLQAKLTEAKNKQKALAIRQQTATDRIRIRTQLHDGRIDEALARYASIERRIDDLEGRAESYDVGRKGPRTLDEEFADLEAEASVEQELAEMKARRSGNRSPRGGSPRPAG